MTVDLIQHVCPKTILALLLIFYTLTKLSKWISQERKICALGGHALRVLSYVPFGLDIISRAIYSTMYNKDLETWQSFFSLGRYTVEASPGGRRCIFTADPENIRAILATQFHDYGKGEPFHRDWEDFLGDSIFVTDLDQWHSSRQLIRPQFAKDRLSDLKVFEKNVQILIKLIASGGVSDTDRAVTDGLGQEINVSDMFFRYTLDTAMEFLLGSSIGSLKTPRQEFAEAFSDVQRVQNLITRAGPLKKLVPRSSFYANLKIIDAFITPYIESVLCLSPEELSTKTKSQSGYTFLHALASFTRDRKVLRDQLLTILLAGRDTTASALSWTFYELARHPEVVKKLRDEIIRTLGLDRPPTFNDLKDMKYLQNTMSETLRIYPVVPFNVRLALRDTTLPRGGGPLGLDPVGILKNTPIAYSTLCMQRRSDLYSLSPLPSEGSMDLLNFNPDRWTVWKPRPWTYIPFNGGPRICLGQQFALTEMGYTIVRILQRFERVERMGEETSGGRGFGKGRVKETPVLKAEIVLQPGAGVWVGFSEAGIEEKGIRKEAKRDGMARDGARLDV